MCDVDLTKLRPCFWKFAKELPVHIHGYMFKKVIGSGGFSIVCLVVSEQYDKEFVAKVMSKENRPGTYDYDYLRTLCHPNIIAIYDQFEDNEFVYLITEYCMDGSMADLIKTHSLAKSESSIIYYMHKILLGLEYCHSKGIAHRDVKPANVMIDIYGRPKWIDFGLSVHCAPNDKVETYDGSGPYKAPEVILRTPYDPFRADIWSLGVMFFEMATGSLPWSTSASKMMENAIVQGMYTIPGSVPPRVTDLIKKMLTVEPMGRPTVRQILDMRIFASVQAESRAPKGNTMSSMLKQLSPKPLRTMARPTRASSNGDAKPTPG